jgi:EAL domain-containing protein (putative c-di-GMP-specific phosphodiesterase class I)
VAMAHPNFLPAPPAGGCAKPGGSLPLPELYDALAAARIRVHYQPIVPMSDETGVALEVLARLEHPTRGMLGPDLFVPPIEKAGLAWPLTEAVVRRAFAEWNGDRLTELGLSLSLNFPLDILLMPAALTWLDRARGAARVPAARVTVELTESRPIGRVQDLKLAVRRLRQAGYGVAIDDVGPGVRDYRDLLELGFSVLKLDRHVVQAGAIRAAHAAGLQVVAEGVADRAAWRRMRALSADHAQGFAIGRPMPTSEVKAWLHAWRARTNPA